MSLATRRSNRKPKLQPLPPLREIRNSISQVEFIFNSTTNYSVSANSYHKNRVPTTPFNSISEVPIKEEPKQADKRFPLPSPAVLKCSSSNETVSEELQIERNCSVIYCSKVPSGLESNKVIKTAHKMTEIEKTYPEVSMGGYYKPQNCIPRFKVAVIIPCRNHEDHLRIFINHIHLFLIQQMLEYRVFVLEQKDHKAFNKGKLLNVGFVEARSYATSTWDCIIMHDVDVMPEDSKNSYKCKDQPKHLVVYQDRYAGYKIVWPEYFGGAVVFTPNQFIKVNGFSNSYWGCDSEDQELRTRSERRFKIFRSLNSSPTRYSSSPKEKSVENPIRLKLISTTLRNQDKDGLSSLKYQLIQNVKYHLYTKITVDLSEK